ncbi:MAG: imelysin family protein [Hyphomicrobiales bacterium]
MPFTISAATETKTPIQKSDSELTSDEVLETLAYNSYTKHILPRYKALFLNSQKLNSSMIQFCTDQSAVQFELVKKNFTNTVISFAAIEHIHFGPIVKNYRLEKLAYWPDHKGRGLRAVRRLLKAKDRQALSPQKFSEKSIAVQGLTALEFVLFGKGSGNGKTQDFKDLFTADEQGRFRCDYGIRLTANIQQLSAEVYNGWKEQNATIKELLNPSATNEHYRNRKEVILEFYQSVTVEMKKIHDLKIQPLFGRKGKTTKPKRAAFWRSGLSLQVIETNIEAMDHFVRKSGFKLLLDKSPVDLQFHVRKMFQKIYASFDGFEKKSFRIFNVLADENAKNQLKDIAKTVSHLNVGFARYFALAADLPLGFNASDGD